MNGMVHGFMRVHAVHEVGFNGSRFGSRFKRSVHRARVRFTARFMARSVSGHDEPGLNDEPGIER